MAVACTSTQVRWTLAEHETKEGTEKLEEGDKASEGDENVGKRFCGGEEAGDAGVLVHEGSVDR